MGRVAAADGTRRAPERMCEPALPAFSELYLLALNGAAADGDALTRWIPSLPATACFTFDIGENARVAGLAAAAAVGFARVGLSSGDRCVLPNRGRLRRYDLALMITRLQ